jgi:Arc/MetJ-type ribon-helix-helix transcriptional regulator
MANSGRNFSLTGHHQRFVDEQVVKRRHSSGSEAPLEALREFIGGVGKRASRRRTARNGASLRAVLFTGPAERQLDEVLEDSEERFGAAARERYEALFA